MASSSDASSVITSSQKHLMTSESLVVKGIVKISFSSLDFLSFILENGLNFFNHLKNVDKIPQHFRGDFYKLHAYFHDAGNKLSANNSQIQFELYHARTNDSSSDIIVQLEKQLEQIRNDWNQAFIDGWINDEFILFNFS